eukprot:357274-Chlamydomonas_euryale.AAC.26
MLAVRTKLARPLCPASTHTVPCQPRVRLHPRAPVGFSHDAINTVSLKPSFDVRRRDGVCYAADDGAAEPAPLVGEDAAAFSVEQQTTKSWTLFTVLLTVVLGAIYLVGTVEIRRVLILG